MRYENHQPPEGINVSPEHPLKEFAQLIVGILLATAVCIAVLTYLAGYLSRFIPFSYERDMVEHLDFLTPQESPQQDELQRLADRLVVHLAIPDDVTITVHYQEGDMVNAFATLGGNIVFMQGLVSDIETEQELAAVMAHELAHIKLRHPIVAAGKGLTLMTLAAVISGASASSAGDWVFRGSINTSMMQFSRAQETAADALAAHALYQEYGDISGAKAMFQRFAQLEAENPAERFSVEAFRSHPYSVNRWRALEQLASDNGWPVSGPGTPLSQNLREPLI